ncbi:hypothetical protein HanIR_Chr06g0266321 [Helianthus annuus]|nr:hypothetical protein HanIR_Chr06g0266321 [Helianthus annuus]
MHKQTIGSGEKAIRKSKKPRRKCNFCNKRVRDHDKRNCPLKKGPPVKDDSSTDEEDDVYEEAEIEESGSDDFGSEE